MAVFGEEGYLSVHDADDVVGSDGEVRVGRIPAGGLNGEKAKVFSRGIDVLVGRLEDKVGVEDRRRLGVLPPNAFGGDFNSGVRHRLGGRGNIEIRREQHGESDSAAIGSGVAGPYERQLAKITPCRSGDIGSDGQDLPAFVVAVDAERFAKRATVRMDGSSAWRLPSRL